MSNQSKLATRSEDNFKLAGETYAALEAWLDRDLQRLEKKWIFLSSPKTQVRCVVLERGDRNDA